MMNNNHKNEGCGFAGKLVSYLYGETDAADRTAFEAHLDACAVCADELKAFSGVHFSINDWKAKEFDVLETPVIEIPYEKTFETKDATVGWLAALRGLFSLTPGWSLATASLAIMAVCVGIVLFALNARKDNQLAERNKAKNSVPSPTVEKSPEQVNVKEEENNPVQKNAKPVSEEKAPQSDVAVKPDSKKSTTARTTKNQRDPQKAADKTAPKTIEKRNNKNNTDVPPSILGDEEEDDTLRLAELFEEIDTDE